MHPVAFLATQPPTAPLADRLHSAAAVSAVWHAPVSCRVLSADAPRGRFGRFVRERWAARNSLRLIPEGGESEGKILLSLSAAA